MAWWQNLLCTKCLRLLPPPPLPTTPLRSGSETGNTCSHVPRLQEPLVSPVTHREDVRLHDRERDGESHWGQGKKRQWNNREHLKKRHRGIHKRNREHLWKKLYWLFTVCMYRHYKFRSPTLSLPWWHLDPQTFSFTLGFSETYGYITATTFMG